MKNIFYLIICMFSINSFGQMIIGDQTKASAIKDDVLMDFEKSNNRGFILPAVNSTSAISEKGTLVLDATTASTSLFRLKKSSTWFDYSRNNGNATSITSNRPANADFTGAKVVIGAETSSADGALVFESTTKAVVLPTVKTVDNIISPSPGMMVFVNKETCTSYTTPCIDQYLAFYNGTEWSFWEYKP